MKKVSINLKEPTITIEMSLSEAKQIRDIIGAISASDIETKLRQRGAKIHPNFAENCDRFYNELFDIVRDAVESNNISVQ